MIDPTSLFLAGILGKPHGTHGEITFLNDYDFSLEPDDFLFLKIDGTFIPYAIESCRFKHEDSLVKLEGVDDIEQAKTLANKPVYASKSILNEGTENPDDFVAFNDLTGFKVISSLFPSPGILVDYDESIPGNPLFTVSFNNKDYLIPAHEDFISFLDPEKKEIHLDIPQGLINLDQ